MAIKLRKKFPSALANIRPERLWECWVRLNFPTHSTIRHVCYNLHGLKASLLKKCTMPPYKPTKKYITFADMYLLYEVHMLKECWQSTHLLCCTLCLSHSKKNMNYCNSSQQPFGSAYYMIQSQLPNFEIPHTIRYINHTHEEYFLPHR